MTTTRTAERKTDTTAAIDAWLAKIDDVTERGKVLKVVILEADHQDDEFIEVSSLMFNCKPKGLR